MKFEFAKLGCALGAMSLLLTSPLAVAGGNGLSSLPPGSTAIKITCGADQYNQRIAQIKQFSHLETGLVAVPGVVGAGMTYLLIQGGGAEGAVAAIPLGLLGVAGANYGIIKVIKHFHEKPFKEVAENLAEASKESPGDKDIRHTADLLERMSHKPITTDRVAQAILDAAASGDLCDAQGKLVVRKAFRKAVLMHLDDSSAQPNPADAEQSSAPITTVKTDAPENSSSGAPTAPTQQAAQSSSGSAI